MPENMDNSPDSYLGSFSLPPLSELATAIGLYLKAGFKKRQETVNEAWSRDLTELTEQTERPARKTLTEQN